MAIAKKPNSNRSATPKPTQEHAAEAFIAGAESPKETQGNGRKVPTMVRFDRDLLKRWTKRPSTGASAAAPGFNSPSAAPSIRGRDKALTTKRGKTGRILFTERFFSVAT
jgi:hypothetical protein